MTNEMPCNPYKKEHESTAIGLGILILLIALLALLNFAGLIPEEMTLKLSKFSLVPK